MILRTLLIAITLLFPLQANAKKMTETEFKQAMLKYTDQQNQLTKKISAASAQKNIKEGARLTCQLDKINIIKNNILKENIQHKDLLSEVFYAHQNGIVKQTKGTLSYTYKLGYTCDKFGK